VSEKHVVPMFPVPSPDTRQNIDETLASPVTSQQGVAYRYSDLGGPFAENFADFNTAGLNSRFPLQRKLERQATPKIMKKGESKMARRVKGKR
jgi:hypothetical protein